VRLEGELGEEGDEGWEKVGVYIERLVVEEGPGAEAVV